MKNDYKIESLGSSRVVIGRGGTAIPLQPDIQIGGSHTHYVTFNGNQASSHFEDKSGGVYRRDHGRNGGFLSRVNRILGR